MRISKPTEEALRIIPPLYEILDSLGAKRYRTYDGGVELHKDNKIFGFIDREKRLYLRGDPHSGDPSSLDSFLYEDRQYKSVQISDPLDKDRLLEEIRKAWQVAEKPDDK